MWLFFFFNDTATTEIYTLSLHDALPISDESRDPTGLAELEQRFEEVLGVLLRGLDVGGRHRHRGLLCGGRLVLERDRKSTRLNSSHANISYAVFCLKKKKNSG